MIESFSYFKSIITFQRTYTLPRSPSDRILRASPLETPPGEKADWRALEEHVVLDALVIAGAGSFSLEDDVRATFEEEVDSNLDEEEDVSLVALALAGALEDDARAAFEEVDSNLEEEEDVSLVALALAGAVAFPLADDVRPVFGGFDGRALVGTGNFAELYSKSAQNSLRKEARSESSLSRDKSRVVGGGLFGAFAAARGAPSVDGFDDARLASILENGAGGMSVLIGD